MATGLHPVVIISAKDQETDGVWGERQGESSREIGGIVSLIHDIANQINILSRNATIQASTTEGSGRGVALVADEVQRQAARGQVLGQHAGFVGNAADGCPGDRGMTRAHQPASCTAAGGRLA